MTSPNDYLAQKRDALAGRDARIEAGELDAARLEAGSTRPVRS